MRLLLRILSSSSSMLVVLEDREMFEPAASISLVKAQSTFKLTPNSSCLQTAIISGAYAADHCSFSHAATKNDPSRLTIGSKTAPTPALRNNFVGMSYYWRFGLEWRFGPLYPVTSSIWMRRPYVGSRFPEDGMRRQPTYHGAIEFVSSTSIRP